MAYIARKKYTVSSDNDLKKELIDLLIEKGVKPSKARQLIYYPTPMSLIRWAKWLDPNECDIYLEPIEENHEDFGF